MELYCECNGRKYASKETLRNHQQTERHKLNMEAKNHPNALVENKICPCTGKRYKSLKTHKKSDKHRFWVARQELKDLREELTRKEIKIGHLKQKIDALQDANLALLNEVASMKGKKRRKRKKKRKNLKDID